MIRHQHFHAVAVAYNHIAAAQFLHPAEVFRAGAALPRQADDVARLDGAVHEQHETADEVRRNGLQAEAKTKADGAGQYGERGQIDAGGIQPQENGQADQEGVGELRDADARGGRESLKLLQAALHPAADPGGDQDEQGQREQQLQHRPDGDTALARRHPDAVQSTDDGIEPAQVFGRDDQPDEQGGARLPMLHPGFVAEAGSEQQHHDAHDDERDDEMRRGVQHGDVELRGVEHIACDHHQPQGHDGGGGDDHALRREIGPGQGGGRLDLAPLKTVAQRGTDEPACQQADRHRGNLDQHVARRQDIEERRDALHEFHHGFTSIMRSGPE